MKTKTLKTLLLILFVWSFVWLISALYWGVLAYQNNMPIALVVNIASAIANVVLMILVSRYYNSK